MKLLESKDIIEELVKESEELMMNHINKADFKNYQQLNLGLLTVQCKILREKLEAMEDK